MIRTGTLLENRYEVLGKIGSGGMADVYKAKCHKLGRNVAIKVLKPEYCSDESFVAKFRAEAQAAARLVHPNVVNVYDVGDDQNLHYIVFELVEGITLKKYIEKKGKLEIRESIGIAMQIAQGMEAAHERKIVHRDIKPQNIMISKDGKVKVTDFGIAKATSGNTINSATMGSVHYISPEQARGGYCDERSDIYSLGITMYEMLTGHVPYEGESAVAVALLHIQGEMKSPLEYDPMIPVSLEKIILKCTQKKPEQRYANVSLLIADLRRALMTPDEDFVKIIPITSAGPTRVMSKDEMEQIKESYQHSDSYEEGNPEELDYLLGIENDYHVEDEVTDEEEEEEEEETTAAEKTVIGVLIGVAVLILILVVYLLLQFFGVIGQDDPENHTTKAPQISTDAPTDEPTEEPTTEGNKTVPMPSLDGKNEEEIEAILEELGLTPKFRYEKSAEIEVGYIISQGVEAGTEVKRGATVQIIISSGTDVVTIPEGLAGKTTNDVREILANLGLKSRVSYEHSDNIAKGNVIRTVPGYGTTVGKGQTITIYESLGKGVEIPDLKDKTWAEAQNILSDLKLKVTVKEEYSKEVEEGYVISQSIEAGNKVDINSEFIVTVSLGAEDVEMPDFISGEERMLYDDVVKALEELGLMNHKKVILYRNEEGDADNQVILTAPKAGEMVAVEDEIEICVIMTKVEEMDELVGMYEDPAKTLLEEYGMKVEIVYQNSSEALGTVIKAVYKETNKDVKAGESVQVGSEIILTVSKGKEETTIVPEIIGLSYEEAKEKLEDAKLYAKIDQSGSATGKVVSIKDYREGDEVPEGTSIFLKLEAPTTEAPKPTDVPESTEAPETTEPDSSEPTTNASASELDGTEEATEAPTDIPTEGSGTTANAVSETENLE